MRGEVQADLVMQVQLHDSFVRTGTVARVRQSGRWLFESFEMRDDEAEIGMLGFRVLGGCVDLRAWLVDLYFEVD